MRLPCLQYLLWRFYINRSSKVEIKLLISLACGSVERRYGTCGSLLSLNYLLCIRRLKNLELPTAIICSIHISFSTASSFQIDSPEWHLWEETRSCSFAGNNQLHFGSNKPTSGHSAWASQLRWWDIWENAFLKRQKMPHRQRKREQKTNRGNTNARGRRDTSWEGRYSLWPEEDLH